MFRMRVDCETWGPGLLPEKFPKQLFSFALGKNFFLHERHD